MSKNKIISFEEFRLNRQGNNSPDNAVTQVLKKDLREQEDLIDWYLFHKSFNKYKLFLHTLFYNNHKRKKGVNPNSGFITIFDQNQIETITRLTEDALHWLNRKFIIVHGNGKNVRQLGESFPYETCRTYSDFYSILKNFLLNTDYVVIIKEFSKSKMQINKAGFARSLIKIIDDAHFHNTVPSADLIFIDYASFLEKSWKDIGLYLNILPSDY